VNVLHGGYEELCHVVWVHKHFVFDSYGFNLYGGVVAGDVGLVPRVVLSVILDGMVRQIVTRKATGVILQMIKDDKIVDLIVLLAGQPDTRKTAITMGMAKSLSLETPFFSTSTMKVDRS